MRLLHTSDWHLGHTLHDHRRDAEHAAFLDWLVETVRAEAVDALVVTGDVFHTANPPARALRAWYDVLARLRAAAPALDIVVVGGNHDSPARLEAPAPLLDALRIRIVGALPRDPAGWPDAPAMVCPLTDTAGRVCAHLAAVPYLRVADLPPGFANDPAGGGRAVYARALAAARLDLPEDAALLVTGHCVMQGASLSADSERPVYGGQDAALPADVFEDAAYVALGHLHRAQAVGGVEHIRYAGSPLPLSLTERTYPHQAVLVTLGGPGVAEIRALPTPRTAAILRLPEDGFEAPEDLLDTLRALPEGAAGHTAPFLDLHVELDGPAPDLRARIEAALADRAVRLARLTIRRQGADAALADAVAVPLSEMTPQEVFERCFVESHGVSPDARWREAFESLLDEVRHPEDPA